ncbi:unnamed protein product [Rotaria sordida]|uniref:Uncharacterized protein n=1 Tax=Rotaria sordida TaxID=392033 RepID=A0A813PI33_9BILA|nr:unnamed protein product [Rotaria sordida]
MNVDILAVCCTHSVDRLKIQLQTQQKAEYSFIYALTDLDNIRIQNDCKQPKEKRRNCKHAIDDIAQICREESASIAVIRLALVTIEQIAFFYEQVKEILLANSYFEDNMITHFSSSFPAGNIR